MKNLPIILAALIILSCKKNPIDNSTGGNVPVTIGNLVGITNKNGNDSTTHKYSYNSANKLVQYAVVQKMSGSTSHLTADLIRNASNIIYKGELKSSALEPYGIEKLTSDIVHDAATSQYKYSLTKVKQQNITTSDSIVYAYEDGLLRSTIQYTNRGAGYGAGTKEEFTYTGKNVTTAKIYWYNAQQQKFDLQETFTYQYDSKVNPLQFSADAILLRVAGGYAEYYSANNITKKTVVKAISGSSVTTTYTYTYNTADKPQTATVNDGTTTSTQVYYYQ